MKTESVFQFLDLIFSNKGYVGRATWWWTQLATVLLSAVILLAITWAGQSIAHLNSIQGVMHDSHLQTLSVPERHKERTEMLSEDWGVIYLVVAGILLLVWAQFVIEIKRWHDLDLSGFLVLIRLLPRLAQTFFGGTIGILVAIAIWLVRIYLLGFRDGKYDHSDEPARTHPAILKDAIGPAVVIVLVVAIFRYVALSIPPEFTIESPTFFGWKPWPDWNTSSH